MTDTLPESQERSRFLQQVEASKTAQGFLRLSTALALASNAYLLEPTPAEARDVIPGMKWEEGLAALRDDVYTASTEQRADAAVLTDGSIYWISSKQGEKTKVTTNLNDVLQGMKKELDSKTLEVYCSFHTHPVSAMEEAKFIDTNEAQGAVSRQASTLSVPPSGTDISLWEFAKGPSSEIQKQGGYEINVVMDPSRIWRHRPALDTDMQKFPDYWREIQARRELYPQWKTHIDARFEHMTDQELEQFFQLLPPDERKYVSNNDRKEKMTAVRYGITKQESLADAFFKDDPSGQIIQKKWSDVGKANERDAQMFNDVVYKQWVPASRIGEPPSELYYKLQETYLRNGTVLESFSYDQVAQNPRLLCRWPEAKEFSKK